MNQIGRGKYMDIINGTKDSSSDKLEGEFRVPLSFGRGSGKSIMVACVKCFRTTCVNVNVIGWICKECNTYNNDIDLCKKVYEDSEPVIQPFHVITEDAKRMINFRDTQALKSDLYAKGIRRPFIGGQKYRKILNNKLKEYGIKK
jgi:hypothetical protein